jgi:hypothetical protein
MGKAAAHNTVTDSTIDTATTGAQALEVSDPPPDSGKRQRRIKARRWEHVLETERRGKRILVIDISFTWPNGKKDRYRHDAKIQNLRDALEESRSRVKRVAAGLPAYRPGEHPDVAPEGAEQPGGDPKATFAAAIADWRSTAPGVYKASTRRRFYTMADRMIEWIKPETLLIDIKGADWLRIAGILRDDGRSSSTVRGYGKLWRGILKYAVSTGKLAKAPEFPKLPRRAPLISSRTQRTRSRGSLRHASRSSTGSRCSWALSPGFARARFGGFALVTSTSPREMARAA